MKETVKTVLVDIDNTVEDLIGAWCEWLDERHGLNVKPSDLVSYRVNDAFPTLSNEQIYEPLFIEDFWGTVKPYGDAQDVLQRLINEGYNVYFCSATHPGIWKYKYEHVIKKYFPFIDFKHIIIAYDKSMIKADFLIDDYPENLKRSDCCKKILFAQPFNRGYSGNITRTDNWETIYNILHE